VEEDYNNEVLATEEVDIETVGGVKVQVAKSAG
jgi:hypothetical protein